MNPINPNLTLNLNREGFGSAENLGAIVTSINAVLSTLDASNNISLSIAYMDASFFYRDASIGVLLTLSKVHDTSIGKLQTQSLKYDASLGVLQAVNLIFNASIGVLLADDTNVDASLNAIDLRAKNQNIITNASLGVVPVTNIITNASLGVLQAGHLIFNASLGALQATDLITNASLGYATHRYALGSGIGKSMLLGIKDASGAVGDFIMSDVSLYFKFGSSAATGYWAVMNASIVSFG